MEKKERDFMDIFGQFRAADSLIRLITGDMEHVTSYPFQPRKRKAATPSAVMPMGLPEEQGVSSRTIAEFFRRMDEDKSLCPHGIVILRHGQRIAEGVWKPYSSKVAQMQFSLSKSVVGMAVGLAISEGLLSLNETMAKIFPDKLPPFYMGKPGTVTVKQLLTMSSGVKFNEMGSISEKDWVRGWLLSDCEFAPGSRFSYNSMNTYMLCAALCRKTGQSVMEYLQNRLWEPLGIQNAEWETCPMGIEKGGWGLYLTPGDMAKLGQLYLQNGRWTDAEGKSKQILPEEWVQQATKKQIDCKMGERDAWYGYQLWGLPWGDGYQFNGVFGQYVVVLPEQDMVIAVTSGNEKLFEDRTLRHIHDCFCQRDSLSETPLPVNMSDLRQLRKELEGLYVVRGLKPPEVPQKKLFITRFFSRPQPKQPCLPSAARYNGRVYRFPKSTGSLLPLIVAGVHGNFPGNITQIRFRFGENRVRFWFWEGEEQYTFQAGYDGEMLPGELCIRGETYPFRSGVLSTFDEEGRVVLKLFLVFFETPSIRTLKFIFYGEDGEKALIRFEERPSALKAVEMLASLVTGGKKPEEIFPETVQKFPLFSRMKEFLCPRIKGKWEKKEIQKES